MANSFNEDSGKEISKSRHNEFLISNEIRKHFGLDEVKFLHDLSVQENIALLLEVTNIINDKLSSEEAEPEYVKASDINAKIIMERINHKLIDDYINIYDADVFDKLITYLENEIGGKTELDSLLAQYIFEFPPHEIFQKHITPEAYLESSTNDIPNRELILQSIFVKMINTKNSGFSNLNPSFQETDILNKPPFSNIEPPLFDFFKKETNFKLKQVSLFELLQQPFADSESIADQFAFILDTWKSLIGDLDSQLLASLDFLNEEQKARLQGPGPQEVYHYDGYDPEHFSPDKDWMPNVILIAKNTFVWLGQLAKKYGIEITKLDQIPDKELEYLANRGFTGLWLIGLWERSKASQKIKQWYGNPEAKGSAYALFDYDISEELGGYDSFEKLRKKADIHNIRLASDMVPNHTGIDSRWILEHPDRFISTKHSPFPSYSFSGESLIEDDNVGVFLEDHYFDHTDAAVVFKRVDHKTGESMYIYHGNDGTSMPWNDTAQLNYLNSEVREQVIQKILHVARLFPIIRFDAAMTLTKLHFQRLWFPEPGTGGDIPSRSQFGISKSEFENFFDQEFWREVVDRIAEEQPNTLLLAEAFWLMEGYFVRTLGMHRVYNSAFMHMLRDEENAKYRTVIKNTLEFNPNILKRFVNYLTNPDEETAMSQFGDGDKYFGICTLMATLPGLPMFGHGQYEGYSEKYGMEYSKSYWDEVENTGLIKRHDREISYLLKNRYIFSGIDNFLLYDFYTSDGNVNEDVFCLSNRHEKNRGLIIYNNKFNETSGWIHTSVAFKSSEDENLIQRNLGEGLQLTNKENYYCLFRDQLSDSTFIRESMELFEKGLYVELAAFKYHVFVEFEELFDDSGELDKIVKLAQGGKIGETINFAKYRDIGINSS